MSIANVSQSGRCILATISTGDGKLQGFTSGRVNVRRGTMIYTFNTNGNFRVLDLLDFNLQGRWADPRWST
jgi:type 1 glutamine amidotransferase